MNIRIKVEGQKLILPEHSYRYISGSRNFIYITFDFGKEWDGMNISAEFAQDSNVHSYLLDSNNGIYLPSVIEPGVCNISLKGSRDSVTATTDSITLYIDKYLGSDGDVVVTYFIDTSRGNITEDDVAAGKIAYSRGLEIKGRHVCEGGLELPELGATAAQSTDISAGKTLYDDKGNPVTGKLEEVASGYAISASDNPKVEGSVSTGIRIKAQINDGSDYILRDGAYLTASAPANQFGGAELSDVREGVTFTSKAGLLAKGTMKAGVTPSGSLDITNNGTYNVTSYATAVVNVPSSGGGSGTVLPDLDNEGDEYCLLEGSQLIAQDGTIVDGRIPINTQDDVTVNGADVSIAPGYYEDALTKSVNTVSQATPSLSFDETTGLITATSNQSAGYVSSGTKTNTIPLDVLEYQEITPGVADQTIEAGRYIVGTQLIKGDSNLTAANIVKGASIFGIEGSAGVTASDLSDVGDLYFWEKHSGDPTEEYCEEEVTGVSFTVYSKVGVSTTTYHIYYSDTYSYDPDTKQFSLNNDGYCSTLSDAQANLPGKYIRYNTTYDTIYRIPDTATFTETTSSYVGTSKSILISNAVKYSASKMLGYVASDNNNTYPNNGKHSDGHWYIYGGLLSDAIEDEHTDSGTPELPEINEVEQATPSISIDSNGLIVASATQEEGYVAEGTKTSEMQLKTVSAQTINPGTTDQKIEAGVYITGTQTIKGDANLKPENIKEGVSIYGLDGTYKATAESITVDSELKPNSTNPIQNKAVYDAINDINNSTNIATYTDPSQFGCTFASTIAEVCNATPDNSIFMCNAGGFTDASWKLPSTYGTIVFFKYANTRKTLNFYGKSLEVGDYQMSFNDQSGEPTGVWTVGLSSVLHSSMYGPKLPGEDGKPYTHVKGRIFFLKASE